MMISLVFLFVNYPVGNLLNAVNRQLLNTTNMGIALAVNALLNILLIPPFDYRGAAIAVVISTILLVVLGLPHVYKIIHFRIRQLALRAGKMIIATASMTIILWLSTFYATEAKSWLLWQVLIGVSSYGLVLLGVRALTISELKQLWRALRQKIIA